MKSVVVASGKGGTGKTTMTAIFAQLAAGAARTVLVDADVEASNLPIALEVGESLCGDFKGSATASIDTGACISCGACQQACRFGAISMDGAGDFTVDQLSCEGCTACARVCESDAISMSVAVAGKVCVGMSSVGRVAFGHLRPGEDLSGKLVTEVRRLGLQEAEKLDADLLLIDGPPGVGCPVIAALANTDLLVAITEPTVSGVHDLARLAGLASRFSLRVAVVLNKADLSDEGAGKLREFCASKNLPLVAEVPFEPELAAFPATLTRDSKQGPQPHSCSTGMAAVESAWNAIVGLLGMEE